MVEMEAGRELDALVAEKVMGWVLNRHEFGSELPGGPLKSLGIAPDGSHIMGLPHFSTNISAAWEVVERLDALGYWFQGRTRFDNEGEHDDGCWAGFTPHLTTGWNGQPDHYTNAPSMPHAICLAALKAVGIDIPD